MPKRVLPLWMRDSPGPNAKKRVLSETKLNSIVPESPSAAAAAASPPVPEFAKSLPDVSIASPVVVKDGEENTPRRRLRSNFKIADDGPPKAEPFVKINIEDVPFIDYRGKIRYFTEMHDVAFACDQLVQWVEKQPEGMVPIAFDLEWPFSFQTGPGRVALMQLCAETDVCYLFQLSCLKKLPAALLQLLNHPRVRLHGVNVKNDFRKLARDFPEANADKMIEQCVDLGQWYNRIHGTTGIWSMERLVLQVCQLRISKNKKVRMSKWHVLPLSDDQKLYAAIDVYIGQEIYLKLQAKELELTQEEEEEEKKQNLADAAPPSTTD